jgi:Zn-dependent protease with chaperone function
MAMVRPVTIKQLAVLAGVSMWLMGCMGLSGERPKAPVPVASSLPDQSVNAERERLVAAFGGEYRAPGPVLDLVREIVNRVVASSDDPSVRYRVSFLNSSSINAFALPTGDIYVTRGLLALANDTSELAAVLAHEVGHVTAKHAAQRAEFEKLAASSMPDPIAGAASGDTRFLLASFSRGQELEADEIGIRTIAKAGYDPYGSARFLSSLARQTSFSGETRPAARFSFLSSHPSTPQRMAAALEVARGSVSPTAIEADRVRYLTALNGLAYGDDPSGGVIRGRRFLHPRLDFTILAPEGFMLENSAQAVVGIAANGNQALRLDTVQAGTTNLEASLAAGWIENAPSTEITAFSVAGFSGATAIAKGPEWTFRLVAIQKNDQIFRIIFAARDLTPALDRAFLAAIGSFRTLAPDESSALKPQRIAVVAAGPEDSAASLATKSDSGDQALDRFLMLNGLDRPKVKTGELYKTMTTD